MKSIQSIVEGFEKEFYPTMGMPVAAKNWLRKELEARDGEVGEIRDALEDMTRQFAYSGTLKKTPVYTTGGLSALENAFDVLGWSDPQPCPENKCEIKGCNEIATCVGANKDDIKGNFIRCCYKHFKEADVARSLHPHEEKGCEYHPNGCIDDGAHPRSLVELDVKIGLMQREIKFRAWDKWESRMLWRDIFDMNWYATERNDEKGCHTARAVKGSDDRKQLILMQYTGLKDKNGKEIYEGDRIKINVWSVHNKKEPTSFDFQVVEWDEKNAEYTWRLPPNLQRHVGATFSAFNANRLFSVIGNIYESPELLK